jgi:hypothetical protein
MDKEYPFRRIMSNSYSSLAAGFKPKALCLLVLLAAALSLGCAGRPFHFDMDPGSVASGDPSRVALASSGRFLAAANPVDGSVAVIPLDWTAGEFEPASFAATARKIDLREHGTVLDIAWGESTELVDVCYAVLETSGGSIRVVRFTASGTLSLSRAEVVEVTPRVEALFDDESQRRDLALAGGVVKEGRFRGEEMIVRVVEGRDLLEIILIESSLRTGRVDLGWSAIPPRVHVATIERARPSDLALSPDGELLFVACPGLGAVRVFKTSRLLNRSERGGLEKLSGPA